jgi:ribA/ribD-fused uncharacterized protein
MAETIVICSHMGPYGELANFYKLDKPIIWNNKQYTTAEHLYHARKFPGAPQRYLDYAEEIRKTSTPYKAKILGQQLHFTRYPWQRELTRIVEKYSDVKLDKNELEGRRLQIMYEVIKCKIEQNQHCRNVLLSTGNKIIIKLGHPYWGAEPDGFGENHIGFILQSLRG